MNKSLSVKYVVALAEKIAFDLGISINDEEKLPAKLVGKYVPPQIYKNGIVSLWVDRSYIAYSYEDSGKIEYVYVSQEHISEERDSYALASMQRGYCIDLPLQIDTQFSIAQREMRITDKKYHIFKRV